MEVNKEGELEEDLNLERLEIRLINKAVNKFKGQGRKKVYDALGVSERTFYHKLKQYNLYHLYERNSAKTV